MSERPTSGRSVTAADLFARQANDPAFRAERRARDEALKAQRAEWRRAERPLVEELAAAGVEVELSWDLVNTAEPYPDAIPVLARHSELSYPDRVREGIARALTISGSPTGLGSYRRASAAATCRGWPPRWRLPLAPTPMILYRWSAIQPTGAEGKITHRRFIPGGRVTVYPNQRP